MNKTSLIFISVVAIALGIAFNFYKQNDTPKTPVDLLFDEVMVVHDDAMALMSDIHKQSKQLKKQLKNADSATAENILSQLDALEKADDSMMEWMAAFERPDKEDEPKATAYLNHQKDKIDVVSASMKKAIKDAQNVINKLGDGQ